MSTASHSKAYRERQKHCLRLDDIEGLPDALVRAKYLLQWDDADPVEIAKATRAMIEEWIRDNELYVPGE